MSEATIPSKLRALLDRLRTEDLGSGISARLRLPHQPKQTLSLFELIYYPLLFIWLVLAVFGTSRVSGLIPNRGMRILLTLFVCVCYAVLVFKPTKREVLLNCFVIFMAGCAFANDLEMVGTSVLMAWCGGRVDLKTAMKVSLAALLSTVSIIVLLASAGVIEDVVYGRWVTTDEGCYLLDRHCLGFGFVSFLGHYWFAIVLLVLYVCHWRPNLPIVGCMFVFNGAIYYYTRTRNPFLLTCVVLLVWLFAQFVGSRMPAGVKTSAKFVLSHAFPFAFVVAIIVLLALPMDSEAGMKLNVLLSNRPALTQEAINTYGVRLLGQRISWSTTAFVEGTGFVTGYTIDGVFTKAPYMYVDSSYFNLMLTWGFLPFLLMMTGLEAATRRLVSKSKYGLATVLLAFAVHSILDPQLLFLAYTPFLLVVARENMQAVQRINTR